MTLGDTQMRVDINVNAGTTLTFFFNTAGSVRSANIVGVQNGERNFIQLKWSEILNGHPVEISQQSQNFIADGNTLVNAEHIHTQFDYDSDGRSMTNAGLRPAFGLQRKVVTARLISLQTMFC